MTHVQHDWYDVPDTSGEKNRENLKVFYMWDLSMSPDEFYPGTEQASQQSRDQNGGWEATFGKGMYFIETL